jgi:Cd2+/Zn2+-exporting ATPase
LSRLPGVSAHASFASRSLKVEFDRDRCALPEIVRKLDELGLRLREGGPVRHDAAAAPSPIARVSSLVLEYHKLSMAGAGALLLLGAWLTRSMDGPAPLRYVLVSLSFVIAGWYTAIETFHILRQLKFDIDVLMFAAAFGAAALGKFEEGALLLVLFAFGGAGEELAMDRARRAIEALAKLAPDIATLRSKDGSERVVKVEDLKPGDSIVVRPFDRLPADGTVATGNSSIDQSPITGESVPVDKSPGSAVFAGTINGEGLLVVTVTKPASESTLSRIVTMVREAQTQKSPTQLFTDRVEVRYVPLVLVMTGVLIVVPPLMSWGTWATWFYRAMAFLTAASPCALAIGTPAAVLSGIARAARLGVLIKGGAHLETLGRVRAIALDKTGTLTEGRPSVTRIISYNNLPEAEVLRLAAAVEQTSSHPLARAIVVEAQVRGLQIPEAHDAQQVPARGVGATVENKRLFAGKPTIDHNNIDPGATRVEVQIDGVVAGLILLADKPRRGAREALSRLKQIGIVTNVMLTGDRTEVAKSIAKEVGIDEGYGDLLPGDKLKLIRSLREQYGHVAMVGDGVNDAPALAAASVGIAMGGAGTDVAIETADIALMGDDLRKLPDAVALSRFSRRIITQNLVIALGVIAVLAPLAALGYAYLGVAVLFHEGSTVVVVLNSMRLLLYKPK